MLIQKAMSDGNTSIYVEKGININMLAVGTAVAVGVGVASLGPITLQSIPWALVPALAY